MSRANIPVKCTRCRHSCMESDWLDVPSKTFDGCTEKTCPRCGCKSFYDLSPQVAWCWASGLIEIGDVLPQDGPDSGGAIEIARGPKFALKSVLEAVARHGYTGKLLVPGVPEAETEEDKCDALIQWLAWCGKNKQRDGVVFSVERVGACQPAANARKPLPNPSKAHARASGADGALGASAGRISGGAR